MKTNINYKLYMKNSVIPSPDDDRDYTPETVCLASPPLPTEYKLPYRAPILDQSIYGSCVAHSLATAMYYGESVAKITNHKYSIGFIYGNRTNDQYQEEGMIIREALKQLNHDGDCLYKDFPYNNTYPWCKSKIKEKEEELKAKAAPNKIINYFRLNTVNDIKRSIMITGSVVCSIQIYSKFGANTPIPDKNEESLCCHAVCIVGWDNTGWIMQNSWGSYWGNKGYFHLPYEYKLDECWGLTVDPTDKPDHKISLSEILSSIFKFVSKAINVSKN